MQILKTRVFISWSQWSLVLIPLSAFSNTNHLKNFYRIFSPPSPSTFFFHCNWPSFLWTVGNWVRAKVENMIGSKTKQSGIIRFESLQTERARESSQPFFSSFTNYNPINGKMGFTRSLVTKSFLFLTLKTYICTFEMKNSGGSDWKMDSIEQ